MKNTFYTLGIILTVAVVVGCTDSKLEQRVQSLEKRVAELEKNSRPVSMNQPANLTSNESEVVVPADGKYPEFDFKSSEHDFGTVKEGDIVNHTYRFINTGEAPLVIKNAVASCGCTVPSWPKKPIAPGEEGKIEVKFDTKNKPNQQTKTITITANTDPSVTRLKLKGMVTPKD